MPHTHTPSAPELQKSTDRKTSPVIDGWEGYVEEGSADLCSELKWGGTKRGGMGVRMGGMDLRIEGGVWYGFGCGGKRIVSLTI